MLTLDIIKEIIDNLDDIIILLDDNNNVLYSNKNYDDYDDYIKNNKIGEFKIKNSKTVIKIIKKVINNYTLMIIKDISDYKNLINEGMKDELTGLFNRLGMRYQLNKVLENKKNKNIVIAIGDIDFFKKINDTYGHNVGDEVLIEIAKILNKFSNEDTSIIRYGGEEFLIIFVNKDYQVVENIINQVKNKIENNVFKINHNEINITMSFGISNFNINQSTISEAIKNADFALYESKKNGRNMVTMYSKLDENKK